MHSREAFFIRLENRTFYGFGSLSASPIAKPFPQFTQFCHAIGLPNTIPNTISRRHGTKKRIYRTSKVNKADTMFDLTFDARQKCRKFNFSSREERAPTTSNSTACWLENISKSVFYCWNENRTTKLQRPSAKTYPLEFSQATPNTHQLIALCLCNQLTPTWTETLSPGKQESTEVEISAHPQSSTNQAL